MLPRMQQQGLVGVGGDKRVRLPDRGTEEDANIALRRRLAEWMVARQIVVRPAAAE